MASVTSEMNRFSCQNILNLVLADKAATLVKLWDLPREICYPPWGSWTKFLFRWKSVTSPYDRLIPGLSSELEDVKCQATRSSKSAWINLKMF